VSVALVDEAGAAGGQIWLARPASLPRGRGPDAQDGERLRNAVAASDVDFFGGCRVWSVARLAPNAPFRIDLAGAHGSHAIEAATLVIASGTSERVVPFPNWTLPGITGLAAATLLLKAFDTLPGQRTVVAGAGPLLFAVAAGILGKGGAVAAVVDLADAGEWGGALPALARRPKLAARGAGWRARVLRARVPVLGRHAVLAAHGDATLEAVTVGRVGGDGAPAAGPTRSIEADSLAIGNGLVPATEVVRALGARLAFVRDLGGWVPTVDAHGRTTVGGLYVAGDCAGVRGADAAVVSGEIAGAAAAVDVAGEGAPDLALGRALRQRAVVGRAMSRLTALRPAQVAAIPQEAVVCRCEDVTRSAIDAAVTAGATDVNQLKHFTRCGMGPCQGRMCGDVAGELLAIHRAGGVTDRAAVDAARREVGTFTGRVPFRPVPLGDLVGRFDYDDIPVPPPAPL